MLHQDLQFDDFVFVLRDELSNLLTWDVFLQLQLACEA